MPISEDHLKAISNGLLAIVSCFAAIKVRKAYPFCLTGFALICLKALTRFISNLDEDSSMVKLRREVSRLCYYLTIPLIATEVCRMSCVKDTIAYLNLVIPVFDYFLRLSNSERISVIELAHFGSLAAMVYCTVKIERFIGLAIVSSSLFTNLVAHFQAISPKLCPYFTIILCLTTVSFLTNRPLKKVIFDFEKNLN